MEKDNEIKETENWNDKHGKPSFEYLQSLLQEGTIESLNTLRSIAEDLDVNFSLNTPVGELVETIMASVRRNSDSTSI